MRRQRNPSKLELFLGVLEQCAEIRKQELAQQFRDTLLRAGALRLLERFGLPSPNAARLFVLDETQARVQCFIDADQALDGGTARRDVGAAARKRARRFDQERARATRRITNRARRLAARCERL
jgi:AcrR family transcriptional regulator